MRHNKMIAAIFTYGSLNPDVYMTRKVYASRGNRLQWFMRGYFDDEYESECDIFIRHLNLIEQIHDF